jgi:tRNA (Thr-GGU) A37 N-methylase
LPRAEDPGVDERPALTLQPIGRMRTASVEKVDAPRQPFAAADTPGVIELFPDMNLEHAIEDLAGWERIWVIFWFDRNTGWRPKVLPARSSMACSPRVRRIDQIRLDFPCCGSNASRA